MYRLAFLLCLASGCATTQSASNERAAASDSGPVESEKSSTTATRAPAGGFDLAAARARELAPLQKQALSPPSGLFTGAVEGSGAITYDAGEGYTSFTVTLGQAAELMCFVYDHPIDTGGALRSVVQAIAADPNLEIERVYPTAIVASGGVPAVFVDVVYVATQRGLKKVGQTKLMVRASSELPVLCAHDTVGYVQTFRRISLEMAAGLEMRGRARGAAPRYSEIHVLRAGDIPAGFEWQEVRDQEGGERISEITRLLMLPRSAQELAVEDTTVTGRYDATGELLNLVYATAGDGVLSLQMKLERDSASRYRYEGNQKGEPVEGTFESTLGLRDDLATASAVREQLLAGKKQELTFDVYRPWRDATKPSQVVLRRTGRGPREISMTSEGNTMTGTVDARGFVERLELPGQSGAAEGQVMIERIFSRGEP